MASKWSVDVKIRLFGGGTLGQERRLRGYGKFVRREYMQ